jgi:DNA-directed RNA polymerase specialized sigma24 family protein
MNEQTNEQRTNSSSGSVSRWIQELKCGDEDAAKNLWERYFKRITGLARKRLSSQPQRVMDEEDVAQSVFRSFCLGAPQGEFPELIDRDDLWPLLARITNRKAVNQIRWANREKRGGGKIRGDSVLTPAGESEQGGFDDIAHDDPTPDFVVSMAEECRLILNSLPDDTYRFVVWSRLEGRTNEEIANLLGVTMRSIERKMQLIRASLARRLTVADDEDTD